jgi:hypothetical protein
MYTETLKKYGNLAVPLSFTKEEYQTLRKLHQLVWERASHWSEGTDSDQSAIMFRAVKSLELLGITLESGFRDFIAYGDGLWLLSTAPVLYSKDSYEFTHSDLAITLRNSLQESVIKAAKDAVATA